MPYQLTQEDIDDILYHFDRGEFDLAYSQLVDAATDENGAPRDAADAQAIAWFKGASDVNAGVGPFSELIRQYTKN